MADIWDLAPVAPGAAATGGSSVYDLAPVVGGSVPPPAHARDLADSIVYGLQSSSAGLALKGKLPEQQMDENAPWYHRLGAAAGSFVGDVPAMAVGAAAGTAVAGPGIGTAAGGFAVPMAIREALMDAYTHNYALNWSDVWEITKSALLGGAKGATIGAVTGGAGKLVEPFAKTLGPAAGSVTKFGTELAALTTTAAAMEGHLPTAQDFLDNALLLGGFKGVAGALRGIYAQTGRLPADVVADAQRNPELMAELIGPTDEPVLRARQTEALNAMNAADAHAASLAENNAPYKDVLAARNEARKATNEYDTLTERLQSLPSPYAPEALDQRIRAAVGDDPKPEQILKSMNEREPAPLTDSDADFVKWEYITDQDTLKGVIRDVSTHTQTAIEAQRRGVVPNRQSAAEALAMLTNGDVVEHQIGTAGNAADILAAASLLKSAASNVVLERNKLRNLAPEDISPAMKLRVYAAIEKVSMLNAELAGLRAESGRSLQMLARIKQDPAFLIDADHLLNMNARKAPFQDLLRAVDAMKDPAQMQKLAEHLNESTTLQKFIEFFRAAIFSGPLTWQANIYGNLAGWAVKVPTSIVSSTITAVERAAAGDPLKFAQYKARALAPLYGMQLAAIDGLHLVREGTALVADRGIMEAAGQARRAIKAGDDKIDVFQNANKGVVGAFTEASFGMLKLQDMPFRNIGEREKTYILATDRAIAEGFHPGTREYREAFARYVDNPTAGMTAERAAAVNKEIAQAGAEAVYSQRLGPRTEKVSSAISGTPWEFIFPARRTPINLLDYAVQHIPGANLLSSRWRADFAAGGEARAGAIARVVVGAGIAATAIYMAQNGLMTGGNLADSETNRTKSAAGEQPYSVLVGDNWYSFARMEPIAKIMSLATDMIEIMHSPKVTDEERSKAAAMTVLAFGNATVSTTYMSGLSNLIKAVTDPARYGQGFVESYATAVVPKIIGQPVTIADPYKREVDGALQAMQSQIPFLREKLLPKRDIWGEQTPNERLFGVMPAATSQASHDKVKTEAVRLMLAIADVPKDFIAKGPLKSSEKAMALTQTQRDIMRDVSGHTAMEWLSPIVNAPDWNRIPDFAQAAIYQRIIQDARKLGTLQALPPDDAARVLKQQSVVDEVIRQSKEAQTR